MKQCTDTSLVFVYQWVAKIGCLMRNIFSYEIILHLFCELIMFALL